MLSLKHTATLRSYWLWKYWSNSLIIGVD